MDPVVKLTQRVITYASTAFVAAAAVPAAVQTPTPVPEPPSADLMMRTIRRTTLLACALLIASCTGGSEVTQSATPVATEAVVTEAPTVSAEPTATPTPEPIVVTEDDRIAAAMAAFEADPQPTELIAYDYLEPLVSTNQIRLTVCGWTGETVFDDVYQVAYGVGQTLNDDGELDVAFESANTTLDTCTNTELIETALQATRVFDNYWTGVVEDPTSFDENELPPIMSPELAALARDLVNDWVSEGLAYQNTFLDGELPGSAETEILVRSYTDEDVDFFELISCRQQSKAFGLYQADVLIDDFRQDSSNGPHGVAQYLLIRRDNQWTTVGLQDRPSVDCNGFEDGWIAAMNRLFADPVPWEVVPS